MGIIGCGKPRQVHSVVKKWVKDKQNVGVVGQVNNQTDAFKLAHERRHAHMISKGTSIRSKTNFCSCR